MGSWTAGWAHHQNVEDAMAKLILIGLGDAMFEQTGDCFPSIAYLAIFANCSEDCVKRKLRFLEKEGWIKRVPHFTEKGRQTSNTYEIVMARGITREQWVDIVKAKWGRRDDSPPPESRLGGGTQSPRRGALKSPRRVTASPPLTRLEEQRGADARISKSFKEAEPSAETEPPPEQRKKVGGLVKNFAASLRMSQAYHQTPRRRKSS